MEVLLIQNEVYMNLIQRIQDIFVKEKAMKLEKTVDMMLSEDYKERFKAEYHQLVNRRNKLQKLLKGIDESTNDFDVDCPYYLLKWQLRTMDDYIYVMKIRAEFEKINLK